jgi:hypothetical protein
MDRLNQLPDVRPQGPPWVHPIRRDPRVLSGGRLLRPSEGSNPAYLQATHYRGETTWTGRWLSPRGDRWWPVGVR